MSKTTKRNRKTQRPSDERVGGGIPTQRECANALVIFEQLPRPKKPPVKPRSVSS